jgi:hypothetical protein
MTETTETTEERAPQWVWQQYVSAAMVEDTPVLRSQVDLMTYQAKQAATAGGLRLVGDPTVNQMEAVLLDEEGTEGEEDYRPASVVGAEVAEMMGVEGSRLILLRLVWDTEPLPEPEPADEG